MADVDGQSLGDAVQTRMIAEQVGKASASEAIKEFVAQHPELRQAAVTAELPPPLKWAAIITSAIITLAASSGVLWLVSSVSEMSVTLARMDERMANYMSAQTVQMEQIEQRVDELENYHRTGGTAR